VTERLGITNTDDDEVQCKSAESDRRRKSRVVTRNRLV